MSKHASSSSTSYGAWALAAWLAALALFLIWLGWVLFSTSPIEGKAEKPSLPGVAQSDPGTVLDCPPRVRWPLPICLLRLLRNMC